MTTRWEVEKAVLGSKLEPAARLVVLVLLSKTDYDTALIPPEYSPSLSTLVAASGLARSAVVRNLDALELLGWVKRSRPDKKSRDDKTLYALAVGADPEPKAARNCGRTGPKKKAGSPSEGLPNDLQKDYSDGAGGPSQGLLLDLPKDYSPGPSSPSKGPASNKNLPTKSTTKRASRKREATPDGTETVEQRVNRLAAVYTNRVKLASFVAVRGVVRIAVGAKVTDEKITNGLNKLADEGRAVTADSLRYAIYGKPRGKPHTNGHQPFTNYTDPHAYDSLEQDFTP